MTAKDIRALRAVLGISQEGLAQRLGVAVITVSRWERGCARPSKLARRQLARLRASHEQFAEPS